ncbi:hypothetical protein [Catenuloplanes atrovinosus]|uniref:Uncharacterized protein n=1 Tax=Catenuloplanes atrovinosus TaxID=137266 RepID=A0AAE4C8I6_9ACTN|nr:hypothetical protein [Catenuloplanes atrovinosus]MDR7274662.1 hypothetical protein [Catenuloplanes atrovinosus]
MGFFDDLPPPPVAPSPPERPRPAWAMPEDAIGVAVPLDIALAFGDGVAVGVTALTAFANGFEVTVSAVARVDDRRGRVLRDGFRRAYPPDEPPGPEFLRFGLRYADGGVATNLTFPGALDAEPAGPLLIHHSGTGTQRRQTVTYWAWPLPPPGPLTVVFSWPARGIDEFRTEIDAGAVRAAADRAVVVWRDA